MTHDVPNLRMMILISHCPHCGPFPYGFGLVRRGAIVRDDFV